MLGRKKEMKTRKCAVTRIRTWVFAATTQSTYHYTITAHVREAPNIDIKSFETVQPSPLLKYNVVNVLYSYAYIIRLFNGSHTEQIQQAVKGLLNLSSVLSHNAVFHDCNSAIKDAITNCQQHKDTATSLEFAYAVMLDVSCIITNGSHYLIGGSHYLIGGSQCLVSHVLSDLHHMIQSSCTKDKSSKKSGTKGVTSAKMLCEVERKVFFMLVWSKEHYSDLLPLQKVIEIEHEGLVKELKEHRDMELKIQEK
ncbi:uncharacterized protein [Dysidea avara]|uniref:uncharacterized protein n=1 Tax=Dysidea avara TaxID=196820 RepID=UPI00332E9C9B